MLDGRHAIFPIFCLTGTVVIFFNVFGLSMPSARNVIPLLWAALASAHDQSIDLSWHEPKKSWINDLGKVLNGTGTYGFAFHGSQLPVGTPYGTYNWCNMPHVRSQEYPSVGEDYELQFVEV